VSWTALAVLSVGAYAFKLAGVVAGERFAERLAPVTLLLPAALFSALVVTMAMADGPALVVDARLIGVVAGVLAVVRRAPMVVVVMVAMAVTALVRVVT
tara:strand:- start:163 stop:459 length:297 start_codon:yes stop_codon:yes gene_type:complete